jgi:hypothetical protein
LRVRGGANSDDWRESLALCGIITHAMLKARKATVEGAKHILRFLCTMYVNQMNNIQLKGIIIKCFRYISTVSDCSYNSTPDWLQYIYSLAQKRYGFRNFRLFKILI